MPLLPRTVRRSLRNQLVLSGAGAVVVTAVVLSVVSGVRTSALADDAAGHVDELVHSSLQQSAAQSANLVGTQVATVTQRMAVELAVAQQRLVDSGGVSFGDPVAWTAKDQVSGEVSQLSLPAVRVGGLWLGQNADLTAPTAFVDETAGLLDAAVTVFQRMDESGNMLRVATSVPTADGTRAIGTYIPATGADATPNAVVTSLLAGQPYYGTASVVGAPYVTAYAPIVAGDQVVGALFVGIPQSEVDAPLRDRRLDGAGRSGRLPLACRGGRRAGCGRLAHLGRRGARGAGGQVQPGGLTARRRP